MLAGRYGAASRFATARAPPAAKLVRFASKTLKRRHEIAKGKTAESRKLARVPKSLPKSNPPTADSAPPNAIPRLAWWTFGTLGFVSGFYIFQMWLAISGLLSAEDADVGAASSDEPTTPVYNTTASYFDASVDSVEYWQGIIALRRKLTRRLFGDVLEVAVGTGRNGQFYELKNCSSVTMIDDSGPMLAIARAKWAELLRLPEWREDAPKAVRKIAFRQMSATEAVPLPPAAAAVGGTKDGFNCILSTFTLCSLPHPADVLAHWCRMLAPPSASEGPERQPCVLLLEHGRSHYDWLNLLLDRSAAAHAKDHGCWWNKDIGAIAEKAAEEAGMEIVSVKRRHFGTTWVIEMRQKPGVWQLKHAAETAIDDVD